MVNHLVGKVEWHSLCEMSLRLTNLPPALLLEARRLGDFVWIAKHSRGRRDVTLVRDACCEFDHPEIFFDQDSGWIAHCQKCLIQIIWTSARSGASLMATRKRSGWQLQFLGAEPEGAYKATDSGYVNRFALSINLNSIRILELPSLERIVNKLTERRMSVQALGFIWILRQLS